MLANFFSNSKPVNFIVILALLLCYTSFALLTSDISGDFINFLGKFLFVFLCFTVLLFFNNFIIRKNKLTFDHSYALLFFVILLGGFPKIIEVSKVFYTNFFLVLFIRKVYSYRKKTAFLKKLFDSGLWLGTAFLLEPFAIVFLVVLYGAIYVYRKITIQSLLVPIIGFIVPFFLYFTYCFWNENLSDFFTLFHWFTYYDFSLYLSPKYIFATLFIAVFTILAIIIKTPSALAVKNTFRKSWFVVILHLVTALALCVFTKHKNGQEILYALLPTAIILANGIEKIKMNLIKEIVLILFLASTIAVHFI